MEADKFALEALAELRCWIGQNKSPLDVGAKCETLSEALAMADKALQPRCNTCGEYEFQHAEKYCVNVEYSGGQKFDPRYK